MADTATTFAGVHNQNEFYSHHDLSEIFTGEIHDSAARWCDATEAAGGAIARARILSEALRVLACKYPRSRTSFAHARRHEAQGRTTRESDYSLKRSACDPVRTRRNSLPMTR